MRTGLKFTVTLSHLLMLEATRKKCQIYSLCLYATLVYLHIVSKYHSYTSITLQYTPYIHVYDEMNLCVTMENHIKIYIITCTHTRSVHNYGLSHCTWLYISNLDYLSKDVIL